MTARELAEKIADEVYDLRATTPAAKEWRDRQVKRIADIITPHLSAIVADRGAWIPVSEWLPGPGIRVLVCCLSDSYVWRTVAQYQPAGTMDASTWEDPPDDWWDEDGEVCTNPEAGWFESPVEGEQMWDLTGVSHWMPLPDAAREATRQNGGGA